jgi:rfaE bifunctional protein nucleotidyltransferase chain/domain
MGLVRRCQELSGREGVFALGVNADASVRVLKGAGRPVMGLEDRACVLSMLRGVFCVFSFTEPTPEALVRWLRPGVFVKGGDWSESSLPEAVIVRRYGGVVELVELVEGASTTAIVDRVRGG